MITDNKSLAATQHERARRWASASDMRGELALAAEEETGETLACAPGAKAEKKVKPAPDAHA
jgi:hypothetical protein